MLNFLQLFQLVQSIVQTVQTVETILPASTGKAKLKAATDSIVQKIEGVQAVVPQLQDVISSVVALFNAAKVFKKK